MTNTINNVPRELLADLLCDDHDKRIMAERHLLAMLANAPSPAGVDGLEVVATLLIDDPADQECGDWDIEVESKVAERMAELGGGQHDLCSLSDAQAIIDGLRGENEALHAQVKVLQSDANSWQSGYDEGRRMGGKHCALTIDQHAQRIGELEGLLRSCLPALSDGGCAALANRIDAALSAVCAAAPNIAPTSEHKVPEGIVSITRSLGRAIIRFNTSEQLNEFYRAAKSALPTERSGQIRSTPR